MPLFGRIGRPGLLGTAARTAVIAGTATATAGAVRRHQMGRLEQQYEAEQYQQLAARQQPAPTAGGVPSAYGAPAAQGQDQSAATAGDPTGLVAQLDRLANLHASGALTDAEFTAAKAKLVS